MRGRMVGIAILAGALSLATAGAIAQQGGPPQDRGTQSQGGMMRGGMMMGQGMMNAGQQGMMSAMMAHHQQMTELMNKLMQSMTALQNEKDPAALKSKMAEHKVLLEQMQQQMKQQGGMMQNFAGEGKNCPMAGGAPNSDTPSK